jgi:uncharacterized membrane protein
MIAAANDLRSVYIWSFLLIAAVVAGCVLVSWMRRRLRQPDEPASVGFSLEDLRQLYRTGQLSQEEFDRARAKIASDLLRQAKGKKA